MDEKLLRLLIEQAAARRDDAARRAADARRHRDNAAATLRTLTDYRNESLERAPVRAGEAVTVEQLRSANRFDARMVAAIHQQHRQHADHLTHATTRTGELLEQERRLKALETLAQRRAQTRLQQDARRDQRQTDEYANHLAARRRPGKEPR
jgi:flagellar FliJ protein